MTTRGRFVWKRYEPPALITNGNVSKVIMRSLNGEEVAVWDKHTMVDQHKQNQMELGF